MVLEYFWCITNTYLLLRTKLHFVTGLNTQDLILILESTIPFRIQEKVDITKRVDAETERF